MTLIEKKIWPKYFEAVKKGEKNYELRLADFKTKKGDTLVLKEWNPKTKEYTKREVRKKVKFVGKTKGQKFWSKKMVEKYGFQIIGF
jgi:ASC-1-like (ASCH) protein